MSTQNQAPIAQFDFDPPFPKVNEEIKFNASDSQDPDANDKIASYKWDFGDGGTGSGEVTTHVYKEAKSYIVTLVVTDTMGASSEKATTTVVVSSNSPVESCDLPQDQEFSGLAWDGQALWSTRYAEGEEEYGKIFKLGTNCSVQAEFKAPGATPGGIAWDGQALWVSDVYFDDQNGTSFLKLFKLDATNANVVGSCKFAGSDTEMLDINAMAWDGQSLWVSDTGNQKIEKINPSGNNCKVEKEFNAPSAGDTVGLAWDGQALWVADAGDLAAAKLLKVNPTNGKVEAQYAAPGDGSPLGLVWDSKSGSFWILDASLKQVKIIKLTLPK